MRARPTTRRAGGAPPPRRSHLALAALLTGTGTAHVVAPAAFERIIPHWLPGSARAWNRAATAAELASAALLASPRTRRLGGASALCTLAAVWVANVQVAVDGGYRDLPGWSGSASAAWLRVPLQVPLLWWSWTIWRRTGPGRSDP